MKIYRFLKKISKKVLNWALCSIDMIKILPKIEKYNHKLKLEESICHDVNKVIMKLEKKIDEGK
jgi:hypothetical protein